MIMCASRSLYISYFPLINPKKIASEHACKIICERLPYGVPLFVMRYCGGACGGRRENKTR